MIIGRIDVVYIVGAWLATAGPLHGLPDSSFTLPVLYFAGIGTILTRCVNIKFGVMDPSTPSWAVGFPSACLVWARI